MPLPLLEPLAPRKIAAPVDHSGFVWELKHDGYRALLYVERRRGRFISRTGREMPRFQALADELAKSLQTDDLILDGELVCLDDLGRSQFNQLTRRDAQPVFYVFDKPWHCGDERERLLRHRINSIHALWPMGVDGMFQAAQVATGEALFAEVCRQDLEGVVGKALDSPYGLVRGRVPWVKVLNEAYSQKRGRAEVFNRRRR